MDMAARKTDPQHNPKKKRRKKSRRWWLDGAVKEIFIKVQLLDNRYLFKISRYKVELVSPVNK